MDESERELVDLRLLITQHEAKMKALQENMKVCRLNILNLVSLDAASFCTF
jgi:hypothetical protein